MESIDSSLFWVALSQIIMINIVLSGDNAVVIALASRSLPPRQQKQAIFFGSLGAIVLRVILTFFAVMLLDLTWLKLIGAVLLAWIGIQMLIPDDEDAKIDGHAQLWGAIKTIILADFIMSLDNVLGVAAAAKGSFLLLVIGLGLSIPLIVYGSTFILKLMNRVPAIVTAGGGVLGWVAGEMAIADPIVRPFVESNAQWLHTAAPLLGAVMVVAVGTTMARAKQSQAAPEPAPAIIDETPVESVVASAAAPAQSRVEEPAPPGYHWVHRGWRRLPDGTRDYAVSHGLEDFKELRPLSSKLRTPRR